jgi:hypothetical protein
MSVSVYTAGSKPFELELSPIFADKVLKTIVEQSQILPDLPSLKIVLQNLPDLSTGHQQFPIVIL